MEVSLDGRTVYFGRLLSSEHDRMNLGVLSLDSKGQPIGEVKYFKDCREDLYPRYRSFPPALDYRSSVIKIVLDSSRFPKKLYLIAGTGNPNQVTPITRLSVYDLDYAGIPKPESLFTPDIAAFPGAPNALYGLALNKTNHKIYLVGAAAAVWVWDLDANGNPTVDAHGVPIGVHQIGNITDPITSYSFSSYLDIAINPELNLLYLGSAQPDGHGTVNPYLIVGKEGPPDANGNTELTNIKTYNFGPNDANTSASGYPGNNSLQFNYTPTAIYRRRSSLSPENNALVGEALHLKVWPLQQGGHQGYPIDTIQQPIPTDPDNKYLGRAETIDPQTGYIWIAQDKTFEDKFSHNKCTSGTSVVRYALNSQGIPTGPPYEESFPIDLQYGMLLANAPSQSVVLLTQLFTDSVFLDSNGLQQQSTPFIGNYYKDYYLRIEIISTTPHQDSYGQVSLVQTGYVTGPYTLPPPYSAWNNHQASPLPPIMVDNQPVSNNHPLRFGQLSDPYPLDTLLQADPNHYGPYVISISVVPNSPTVYFQNLVVQINIYQGDPATNPPSLKELRTDASLAGNAVLFILPSYNFSPNFLDQIELYSNHVKKYLEWSKTVAVAPNDRPKRFIISGSSVRGLQGDLTQLKTEVGTLANLGINTAITATTFAPNIAADNEWPGLDVIKVQSVLNQAGIKWRSAGVYNPFQNIPYPLAGQIDPIFYFYLDPLRKELDNWTKQVAIALKDSYVDSFANLVDFKLRDEPGWSYPNMLDIVNNTPLLSFLIHAPPSSRPFCFVYVLSVNATVWTCGC
jgi:hypothetical protein